MSRQPSPLHLLNGRLLAAPGDLWPRVELSQSALLLAPRRFEVSRKNIILVVNSGRKDVGTVYANYGQLETYIFSTAIGLGYLDHERVHQQARRGEVSIINYWASQGQLSK